MNILLRTYIWGMNRNSPAAGVAEFELAPLLFAREQRITNSWVAAHIEPWSGCIRCLHRPSRSPTAPIGYLSGWHRKAQPLPNRSTLVCEPCRLGGGSAPTSRWANRLPRAPAAYSCASSRSCSKCSPKTSLPLASPSASLALVELR